MRIWTQKKKNESGQYVLLKQKEYMLVPFYPSIINKLQRVSNEIKYNSYHPAVPSKSGTISIKEGPTNIFAKIYEIKCGKYTDSRFKTNRSIQTKSNEFESQSENNKIELSSVANHTVKTGKKQIVFIRPYHR
jgi:hypothetical protein